MKMLKYIWVFLFVAITSATMGQNLPEKVYPPRLVNDFVGILNDAEANQLEAELVQFNRATSTQISVVVVDDLLGMDASDYTIRLAEKWGIGQKGKDNGILIMIKPTGSTGQRRAFIAVGYGLEGVIPDAIANRIVDQEMVPLFAKKQYFQGITAGVNTLKALALGEFSADDYVHQSRNRRGSKDTFQGGFIVLVLFLMFFVKPLFMARNYASTNHMGFWLAFWMILSSGRSNNDHWHHFTGGSGFGGGGFGGGSGGFGGFGGGSFGGGGAGGSW